LGSDNRPAEERLDFAQPLRNFGGEFGIMRRVRLWKVRCKNSPTKLD